MNKAANNDYAPGGSACAGSKEHLWIEAPPDAWARNVKKNRFII